MIKREDYNFICKCRLKHSVCVDEKFLGKRIPIRLLEIYDGVVYFPILKQKEDPCELIAPYFSDEVYQDDCGDVSITKYSNKQELHPIIKSVYFSIKINGNIQNEVITKILSEIERLVSKFIKCISLVHLSAIQWSYTKEEAYVDTIKFYQKKDINTQKWVGHANVVIAFRSKSKELSSDEFWKIYRGIGRNLTLQYELLSDVNRCLARKEFREVVLNCAIIIEKTLKEQIVDYLDKEQTAMRIKDHILRLADGFTKISDTMKKFGMLTDNHQKIKKGTIEVRNRIIHGGYFPTILEVEQAIDDAKFIIQQYNVKLFID